MRGTNSKLLRGATKRGKRLFQRLTDQEKYNVRFMIKNGGTLASAIEDMGRGDYSVYFDWMGEPRNKWGDKDLIKPRLRFERVGRILY